jgi:hypothetical protein
MIKILLDILSALCLLPWLLFLATLVVFAILIACRVVQVLSQTLCKIGRHAVARMRFGQSDHQFLRNLGIKHDM